MKSHEVLKKAVVKRGAKMVASELGVSSSLLYKWTEESVESDPQSSGARNPLDRIMALCRSTGDVGIIQWLCEQNDGFFAKNPEIQEAKNVDAALVRSTQVMIKEFSDLLEEISASMSDDGTIDKKESEKIRREWEGLKRQAESFVVGCEKGMFREGSE